MAQTVEKSKLLEKKEEIFAENIEYGLADKKIYDQGSHFKIQICYDKYPKLLTALVTIMALITFGFGQI